MVLSTSPIESLIVERHLRASEREIDQLPNNVQWDLDLGKQSNRAYTELIRGRGTAARGEGAGVVAGNNRFT